MNAVGPGDCDGLKGRKRFNVLGVGVSLVDLESATADIVAAARIRKSGYVCVTGAHGVIESQRDRQLRLIHNRSLLTVPDGMPNVWIAKMLGHREVGRVYGPDLMLNVCRQTALPDAVGNSSGCKPTHFLYGSTPDKLIKLQDRLEEMFTGICIVGRYAPPFRPLDQSEELELRSHVAECRPDFFWVGLSTPKQERFMASHCPGVDTEHALDVGVMLGVGAAFDLLAGDIRDAPQWIKNIGLQWLHRLCCEPRRLAKRYASIVPAYIWLNFLQLMGIREWNMEG